MKPFTKWKLRPLKKASVNQGLSSNREGVCYPSRDLSQRIKKTKEDRSKVDNISPI